MSNRLGGELTTGTITANAVRDYDYMIAKAKEAKNMGLVGPFEISSR